MLCHARPSVSVTSLAMPAAEPLFYVRSRLAETSLRHTVAATIEFEESHARERERSLRHD